MTRTAAKTELIAAAGGPTGKARTVSGIPYKNVERFTHTITTELAILAAARRRTGVGRMEEMPMYFVVIDLHQLYTRLLNSSLLNLNTGSSVDVHQWLRDREFVQSEEGWLGTADSMNRLSCSEIIYSERRMMPLPGHLAGFARPVSELPA